LRPEDVRLIPLDVIDMPRALAERRIDAFSAWEPTPAQAVLDYPDFEILARMDARGYVYFTRDFYERHPRAVRAVVASEIRALRWLRSSEKNLYIACRWAYDRAAAFGGEEPPTTVYDFHRLARRDILRVPEAPRLRPELLAPSGALHRQFRLSRALGLIDAAADWQRVEQSFVLDLVPQLLAAPREHHLDDLRLETGTGEP
jgi:NitT/TauT family transport system substrate-binding protein